tara:strand:- start:147 stop:365 length:219 start_codon:yes stop_codon:yes gene_type:complete
MFKYFFLIFFIFLNNCSIDTKTGLWKNKNIPKKNKKLANINFDSSLSYENFKNNIIEYGKLSNFPKLDENEK